MIFRLLLVLETALWGFGWYIVADAYGENGSLAAGIVASLVWILVGSALFAALREIRR